MQTERALAAVKAKRQKTLVVPRNGAAAGLFFLLVGLYYMFYTFYTLKELEEAYCAQAPSLSLLARMENWRLRYMCEALLNNAEPRRSWRPSC